MATTTENLGARFGHLPRVLDLSPAQYLCCLDPFSGQLLPPTFIPLEHSGGLLLCSLY